jgi:hypothetical protein
LFADGELESMPVYLEWQRDPLVGDEVTILAARKGVDLGSDTSFLRSVAEEAHVAS